MKRSSFTRHYIALLCVTSLMATSVPAYAKQHAAKSEVDKATGKCVGAILGGILLGALAGAVTSHNEYDPRTGQTRRVNNTGTGAAIGGGVGVALCAILKITARHKDKLIAAQREAATSGRAYSTSYDDVEGGTHTLTATSKAYTPIGSLTPVNYVDENGRKTTSPEFVVPPQDVCQRVNAPAGSTAPGTYQMICKTAGGTAGATAAPKCRRVDVTDTSGSSSAAIQGQIMCLNPTTNRMEPYADSGVRT